MSGVELGDTRKSDSMDYGENALLRSSVYFLSQAIARCRSRFMGQRDCSDGFHGPTALISHTLSFQNNARFVIPIR